MRRSAFSSFSRSILMGPLLAVMLTGCGPSHKELAATPQALHGQVAQKLGVTLRAEKKNITMEVFPLVDRSLARSTVGASPKAVCMIPAFLRLENMTDSPVKVDLLDSTLLIGGKPYSYLASEEAADRARIAGDVGLSLAMFVGVGAVSAATGGLGGAVLAGGTSAGAMAVAGGTSIAVTGATAGIVSAAAPESPELQPVDQLYQQQSFHPSLIAAKRQGAGMVFFDVPWEEMEAEQFGLRIPVSNLRTGETLLFEFAFSREDLKPKKETKE